MGRLWQSFAVLELILADLEANIARDKYARLCTQIESLVSSLKTDQAEDMLSDIAEQLVSIHIKQQMRWC